MEGEERGEVSRGEREGADMTGGISISVSVQLPVLPSQIVHHLGL
jgi:hypothetical protein